MRIDAPGLVAAAQRLILALEGLAGSGVGHPPLAADPASVVAGERLSTAGAELTAALVAHVAALVGSIEFLTGAAFAFVETDAANAAIVAALRTGSAEAASVPGFAAPPPPIPPDLRAPMPPPVGMTAHVVSAGVHTGDPAGGEPFIAAWTEVVGAARHAADEIRSAVASLPDVLDAPVSTEAVTVHLLKFATGLNTYADRGATLVRQATTYGSNLTQARADIPTPQQLTTAETHVRTIQAANVASGGKHAVPLARAVSYHNQLQEQAVTNYPPYQSRTDAATAGEGRGADPKGPPAPGDPGGDDVPAPAGPELADPGTGGPLQGDPMTQMVPELMSSLVGGAGGLLGAGLGAVTAVPSALMGAASAAMGAATGGLSGLGKPKLDPPNTGEPGSGADPGTGSGDGGAPTTAAGGEGLPIAPATGGPPTPAIAPVGAADAAQAAGTGSGSTGMPMGMPMGGLGGAPGGAAGKGEPGRKRKVVVHDIPHTEDVTGRVDTSRLSAAASATHRERSPEPPDDGNSPDPTPPVVRRLVTRKPEAPS